MRIFRISCIAVIVTLTSLAMAKLSVPNGVLGKVEGAMDFCAQADPQSADQYKDKKKEFSQGATEEELADARASREYKEGYHSATDEMSKQPKEEAKNSCAAALAGN